MRKLIQLIITILLLVLTTIECIETYPLIKEGFNGSDAVYNSIITAFCLISFIINLIYLIRLMKNKNIGNGILVNCLVLTLIIMLFTEDFIGLNILTKLISAEITMYIPYIFLVLCLLNTLLSIAKNNITINSRKVAKIVSIIILLAALAYELYNSIPLFIEDIKGIEEGSITSFYTESIINTAVLTIGLLALILAVARKQRFIVLAAILSISYEFGLIAKKATTLTNFDNNNLIEFGKYAAMHLAICIIIRIAIAIAKSKETRREI